MSEAQLKSLVILPKVSGGLSIVGSALICADIFKDRKTKLKKMYHRLLFVMSFMDMFFSFSLFLSTWPKPKDDASLFAVGNEATCTAQGFIMLFFAPAIFFNAYLGIYYVLTIVYGWPEHRIVPWEKGAYVFTLLFSCATAFTALAFDLYGPTPFWCFVTGWHTQLFFNVMWQWLCFCIVLVCMLFLCWKIRQQLRTSKKYGEEMIRASVQEEERDEAGTGGVAAQVKSSVTSLPSTRARRKNSSNPMSIFQTQAALYCLSFLLTEAGNVGFAIAYYTSGNIPIWLVQFIMATLPLQGFWNCLIYARPRYMRYYAQRRRRRQSVSGTGRASGNTNTTTHHPAVQGVTRVADFDQDPSAPHNDDNVIVAITQWEDEQETDPPRHEVDIERPEVNREAGEEDAPSFTIRPKGEEKNQEEEEEEEKYNREDSNHTPIDGTQCYCKRSR